MSTGPEESSLDFVDTARRLWTDVFPWLTEMASSNKWLDGGRWKEPIDESDIETRRLVLNSIVSVAIERLGHLRIGDILPVLPLDLPVAKLVLSVPESSLLHYARCHTTGDLADLPLDDLTAYRDTEIDTATSIFRKLADLSTLTKRTELVDDRTSESAISNPWRADLINDIEVLAKRNLTTGQLNRSLLDPLPSGAPPGVVNAHDRVLAQSAAEVLPSTTPDVAELLEQAILGLDDRSRVIVTRRLFAWAPATLEELGQEFGVTRERIRQLETKARAKLQEVVAEGAPAGGVVTLVRSEIHGIKPLSDVLIEVPALDRLVETVNQPAWRIVAVLDNAYEIADDWCTEPNFVTRAHETSVVLEELADECGVVRLADIDLGINGQPGKPPWLADWLSHLGYQIQEEFALLRTRSVNDLAAALLSIEGSPMSTDQLFQRVQRGSMINLRNQLNADLRFHKVDIERWALTSWGMVEYSNIRTEISKLLEQAGGELALATVIKSLVERFGVSAGSVNAFAGSAPFEVRNGIVRNQSGFIIGGKNPAKVQGYYQQGKDWFYRTTVTHDHLRGSGWGTSTALATIVGISAGGSIELKSRLGPQPFSWKHHQPTSGSIKRFLAADGVSIGEDIFLIFTEDGSFDVAVLPEIPAEPLAQALRLVGSDPSLLGSEAMSALGAAIKLPPDSDITHIALGYEVRRDIQIHDLLIQHLSGCHQVGERRNRASTEHSSTESHVPICSRRPEAD